MTFITEQKLRPKSGRSWRNIHTLGSTPKKERNIFVRKSKHFVNEALHKNAFWKQDLWGLLCGVCLPVVFYVLLMRQPFVLLFLLALVWWTNKFISKGFLRMGIDTSIWAFTESAVQPELVFIPLDEHRWTQQGSQSINESHHYLRQQNTLSREGRSHRVTPH